MFPKRLVWLLTTALLLPAADFPQAEITNGQLRVKLYLPDANSGFYRATRFDWSGMIYSLLYFQTGSGLYSRPP